MITLIIYCFLILAIIAAIFQINYLQKKVKKYKDVDDYALELQKKELTVNERKLCLEKVV